MFMTAKGRLQTPTAGWPTVPPGSGQLPLFRTIETGRNRTEPPVNRLCFEAVPNLQFFNISGVDTSVLYNLREKQFIPLTILCTKCTRN